MFEHRTDEISRELRTTAPPAPDELRRAVREIAAREGALPPRRGVFGRMAAVAVACLVVLTAAAALTRNGDGDRESSAPAERQSENPPQQSRAPRATSDSGEFREALGGRATLPPARRLQDYRASLRLRVDDADDLSAKAQRAMRETRRMGGFVASVDFATEEDGGDAMLVLRVPVTRIQDAVARFSELGTIVAQQVSIDDLQPQADRLARTIARLSKQIAELERKARQSGLTTDEQVRLELARQQLRTTTQRRSAVVRQATYATVSLALTTADSTEKQEPGAFNAFWDDAKAILTTELIWLLYALVVAGPFLLLAIGAALAERARRRRSANALLAHH